MYTLDTLDRVNLFLNARHEFVVNFLQYLKI